MKMMTIGRISPQFKMASYLQGDIIVVEFPFTDGIRSKVRPAVIISNGIINCTSEVLLVPITTTIRQDSFSYPLTKQDVTHSLDKSSEIRCHKLFLVEKTKIIKKISKVLPVKMKEICEKVYAGISHE